MTAPIALFVYNRPEHTKKTIEALQKNDLASESEIYIFSDAANTREAYTEVQKVRNYISTVSGFKSVNIIEREHNWGLAASIIDGVTQVVKHYGKTIVMEDDLITSPSFLRFMNASLIMYNNEKSVWHISGWNYPIGTNNLDDAFFWRFMNCWGWATWADRWAFFNKNPQRLINTWSQRQKDGFDIDGSGSAWNQVLENLNGNINTWAVFWYATIYENNGLCLNPAKSYVRNIGHDGSGIHCGKTLTLNVFQKDLNRIVDVKWPSKISESKLAISRILKYQKKNKKLFSKIVSKINYILFKFIK